MKGFLSEERPIRTLREVLQRLRESYCGKIGYEYMHIPDRDRCNWLRERIETPEEVGRSSFSLRTSLPHPVDLMKGQMRMSCMIQFRTSPLSRPGRKVPEISRHATFCVAHCMAAGCCDARCQCQEPAAAAQISYTPDRKLHILSCSAIL